MKILFCWTDISGYMAACWRALTAREGVDLTVLAYDSSAAAAFDASLMQGLRWIRLESGNRTDAAAIQSHVNCLDADVVVIAGWRNPAYRRVADHAAAGTGAHLILAMDTPWRGTVRQQVARLALRRYCSQFDAAWIPGDRGRQYARRLGFPRDRILEGVYGFDWQGMSLAWDIRQRTDPRPRRFLFIGRYVCDKGFDLLLAGYARYRDAVDDPWEMACCGRGPLDSLLTGQAGVSDRGFRQPDQLISEIATAGALVAPSRYDPWNVAIMEAAAGGLPILCSRACGVSAEVVRDGINGHAFPTDSVEAVTRAMMQTHHATDLDALGTAAREAVRPYAADAWADRLIEFVNHLGNHRVGDATGDVSRGGYPSTFSRTSSAT